MQINSISVGLYRTNCYIVSGTYSNEKFLMVIDPGDHYSYIESQLTGDVTHIVLTHYHPDHIGALNELKKHFPSAKVYAGQNEKTDLKTVLDVAKDALGPWFPRSVFALENYNVVEPDIRLKEHDCFLGFEVLETPGHTPGSICLLNRKEKCLFSGDTIFSGSYGRTDFIGGNYDDMMFSIQKIMTLDDDITIYPGHNEPTFIGKEKQYY